MSEDDWIRHWEQIAKTLYMLHGFDRPRPISHHLNALEGSTRLRLPLSYRAFIRTFGPGRLAQAFTVYSPGYPDASVVDFLAADCWQEVVAKDRGNDQLISRLVAFGDYLGTRGLFAWDREHLTESASPEYQIYFVPRDPDDPVVSVTDSFAKWVENETLSSAFYPRIGVTVTDDELAWEDDDTGEIRSHRCFEPIGQAPQ